MQPHASDSSRIAYYADLAQILSLPVAFLAVVLAGLALFTWRRELRANVESQAAIHLLGAAHKLRDAIAAYRRPMREMREIVIDLRQSDLERRVLDERNRFYLSPVVADLREAEVKARVLWGDEVSAPLEALTSCVFELEHQKDEYLRRLSHWPDGLLMQSPFFGIAERVVKVPVGSEGPDAFGERVEMAVAGLAAFLLPKVPTYLGQKRKSGREKGT